ncbi:MAG: hypothetical protein JWN45_1669 [Acidobacteriaceae bacterium]|jgi:hypothetical protein|nr:hypothetical protein [Acidobacteriaceae bacterium]
MRTIEATLVLKIEFHSSGAVSPQKSLIAAQFSPDQRVDPRVLM